MDPVTYHEITCVGAINHIKGNSRLPYANDLNSYRGCLHRCQYCFALYSHQYMGTGSFYHDIYVKTNIAQRLERELASPSWKRDIVNLGGVTDSYQPAEAHYRLMPDILRLLIKYKTPAIISTKSDLILRDYDLIDELSRLTYVNVAATITTMDERLRSKLEPGAVPSRRRFEMLHAFSKTNASIGLHIMPVIPYLTDSYENQDAILAEGKRCGALYALTEPLNLRGNTKHQFMLFLKKEYPKIYPELAALYQTGSLNKEYKQGMYRMLQELKQKHDISSAYRKWINEKLPTQEQWEQLSLF